MLSRIAAPAGNIELKARLADAAAASATCRELGAAPGGILAQTDTYFAARRGRLKLREEAGAPGQLIAYDRADAAAARRSNYRIVAVEDCEGLKSALAASLGLVAVVKKRRRLFLWRGVRIHLDRVEGLGEFIELEAVLDDGLEEAEAGERVQTLRASFGIADADLIATSYCDLAVSASAGRAA